MKSLRKFINRQICKREKHSKSTRTIIASYPRSDWDESGDLLVRYSDLKLKCNCCGEIFLEKNRAEFFDNQNFQ